MRRVLYFFCFVMMALGALWRVGSWLLPVDPARVVPWYLSLGDPVPPPLYFYIPEITGTLCFLLVLFLVLKRLLIFLGEGALVVPDSFTSAPAILAGIGLASCVLVTVFGVLPVSWRENNFTSIWLMDLTLLVVPVSFYLTEIRSLVAGAVSGEKSNATRHARSAGAGAVAQGVKGRTRSVFSPPPSPTKWSWLVYAVIWFGVSAMILRRFGGLPLYDSTRPLAECLVAFAIAGIPGGLVTALIKIFADPIFIGLAEKQSKVDMAEELLDSVALTAVGVAAEGALSGATGATSGGSSGDEGFSGGGGSSGGGGASGSS